MCWTPTPVKMAPRLSYWYRPRVIRSRYPIESEMTPDRLTGERMDPVLEPFLHAPLESAAEHDALGVLIDRVTPVIEGVIRGRAGAAVAATEREELFGEAILLLIRRLQELKSAPSPHPIANFNGYAAVTAFNVVHAHFRR